MSQFRTYLTSFQTSRHWLLAALGLALVCLLCQIGADSADQLLKYQRSAVLSGAWWQIISCHFVHYSWAHLGLNMAGLFLLPLVLQPAGRAFRLLAASLFVATWIGFALLLAEPGVSWYLGFSGILTGLYIAESLYAILSYWRQCQQTATPMAFLHQQLFVPAAVLLVVGGKVVLELNAGIAVVQHSSLAMPILTAAHFHGAIAGLVLAILLVPITNTRAAFTQRAA